MSEFWIVVGLLAGFILVLIIIGLLADLGWWLAKLARGTTVFISAGETMRAIWPNVGGFRMSKTKDPDGRHWLIPVSDKDSQKDWEDGFFEDSILKPLAKLLWKWMGVRFISFLWPQVHVQKFDIRSKKRIKERTEVGEKAPLRSRIEDVTEKDKTIVDSLLFVVPRPVYLEGIELAGDNAKINVIQLPVYRQVIPELPVYYLKGDFFSLLDAAIGAAFVDFCATHLVAVYKKGHTLEGQFVKDSWIEKEDKNEYDSCHLTYAHWLKLTKAGEGSPLEQRLKKINFNQAYYDLLAAHEKKHGVQEEEKLSTYVDELAHRAFSQRLEPAGHIPSGIVPRFGFALISLRTVDWEPHEGTQKLAEAILAKETQLHTAEGVREKAYGERDAAIARAKGQRATLKAEGQGELARNKNFLKALVDKDVNPDVAANVLATQLRTENIKGAGLTTYIEGGASASVLVDASRPKKPAPSKEAS